MASLQSALAAQPAVRVLRFCINNWQLMAAVLLLLLANIGLSLWAYAEFRASDGLLVAAKMTGRPLNLNCSLILVFVLRKTFSACRRWRASRLLPIEQSIRLHSFTGCLVCLLGLVHSAVHIVRTGLLVHSGSVNCTAFSAYLYTCLHIGWVYGTAAPTGFALLVMLLGILVTANPAFRARFFKAFHYSHLLCYPFLLLCILHSRYFWLFVLLPLSMLLLEQLLGTRPVHELIHGKFTIESVNFHAPRGTSDRIQVAELVLRAERPVNFSPGAYVSVNVPAVSQFEFHPFTISSPPERRDCVTVHVQAVGPWTRRLHDHFRALRDSGGSAGGGDRKGPAARVTATTRRHRTACEDYDTVVVCERVFVEGPYEVHSKASWSHKHVIMVSAGIGITPYASILRSLVHRKLEGDEHVRSRRVDFVWVARSLSGFRWFADILEDLEAANADWLSVHLFLTGAAAAAESAEEAVRLSHVTYSRPDWLQLLDKLSSTMPDCRSWVYTCASPLLADSVADACWKLLLPHRTHCF